jgi:murein DD-endopeptidase MepM/ murein hydrolase activator NlpD
MTRMCSVRRGLVVSLVAAGIAAGAFSAFSVSPGRASEILRVTPASPMQGDTLVVTVSAPTGSRVMVRYDGAAVAAYALPDGTRRALIGTDPTVSAGSHTVAVTITEASAPAMRASRIVRITPGRFEVRTLTLPPQTFGLITPQNGAIEWRALGPVLSRRTPEAMWTGVFAAPSDGVMDSPYGYQSVYNGHREWWHQGVDFAAPAGSPVAAANAGVVALAQLLPLGGNTVVIDHGQGVLSEYLHLSAFTVHLGARVERGALIGRIGATGLVTGPSLHWGLYVNGTWVNPLFWTEPRAGLTR